MRIVVNGVSSQLTPVMMYKGIKIYEIYDIGYRGEGDVSRCVRGCGNGVSSLLTPEMI